MAVDDSVECQYRLGLALPVRPVTDDAPEHVAEQTPEPGQGGDGPGVRIGEAAVLVPEDDEDLGLGGHWAVAVPPGLVRVIRPGADGRAEGWLAEERLRLRTHAEEALGHDHPERPDAHHLAPGRW